MILNAYRAKSLAFPWPPVLYALAILTAVMFDRLLPIPVTVNSPLEAWLAGSVFVIAAVSLDLWAMRTLLDKQTAILPHRCSRHLVTCGPYRFTRNPIYLGYTLMMTGFGLIMLNPWFFILALCAVAWTTATAIRYEEKHLLARFGFEFERYCRTTSRWI